MRRKSLVALPLITIIFFLCRAQAQTKITGSVHDAETGAILAGANILLEELNLGTISDGEGKFIFRSIPPGKYTVSAGFVGYQILKQTVRISGEAEYPLVFGLMPAILAGQSIEITSTRAREGETPVTFSNLTNKDISNSYTAADIPMILDKLPNTYSYSLTGDNLGYSFLSIRGFDQKRVGVMINDIPMNDPEDHQVYWVDLPDLAESTEDIQVQRGVGSSIYGTSTFGGSVNILTKNFASDKYMRITFGGGSYNTIKALAEYKSGLIDNTYAFYARVSQIASDGYRLHSQSDLWAYFIGMERYDRSFVTRINIINGHERTHPDWYGIPSDILSVDRRYKYETYDNAVDDFTQPQVHLISEWNIGTSAQIANTFYYIHGSGYYENLKEKQSLDAFGMRPYATSDPNLFGPDSLRYYATDPEVDSLLYVSPNGKYEVTATDLVRQKWVKKNQYGWIGKLTYGMDDGFMTIGASVYGFASDHYGKVLWAKHLPVEYDAERKYYGYSGERFYSSGYFNMLYNAFPKTKMMANLLYEYKNQKFKHRQEGLFAPEAMNRYQVNYNFFSPRVGVTYSFNERLSSYWNISFAQREPSDDDLYNWWSGADELGQAPLFARSDTIRTNGQIRYIEWQEPYVQPESVVDYETGISFQGDKIKMKGSLYYMDFRNEIVLSGDRDNEGRPIKGNADKTVHTGVEMQGEYVFHNSLHIGGNAAYSKNYFKAFIQREDGEDRDQSGNNLAGFPNWLANFYTTINVNNLNSTLSWRYVGKRYLDNTNNKARTVAAYNIFNLHFSYRIKNVLAVPEMRMLFRINNLFNVIYETYGYYDSWSETAYLYPGAPRNYYLGIVFSL
jgi:iron complex outermembrane receptor protein